MKNNSEQINHQVQEKRHNGVKKSENKETLTLKNTIKLKIIIAMTMNYRNQDR